MGVNTDNVVEHLKVLFKQELSGDYQVKDYLGLAASNLSVFDEIGDDGSMISDSEDFNNSSSCMRHSSFRLTPEGRRQIGQWFYRIIGDFRFPREIGMISMDYFDRVLSRVIPPTSKEDVQLIALACFYLAVKLFQAGPVLSIHQMVMLSGGTYTSQQVSSMEKSLLFTLQWSVHPCCESDFIRPFFMSVISKNGFPPDLCHYDVLELALGILHTGTLDYFFTAYRVPSSHKAAAALLNAMHAVLPVSYPVPSVEELVEQIRQETGYKMDKGRINLCRQRFCALLLSTDLRNIQESADEICHLKNLSAPECSGKVLISTLRSPHWVCIDGVESPQPTDFQLRT